MHAASSQSTNPVASRASKSVTMTLAFFVIAEVRVARFADA
jgi:hypothetical protein